MRHALSPIYCPQPSNNHPATPCHPTSPCHLALPCRIFLPEMQENHLSIQQHPTMQHVVPPLEATSIFWDLDEFLNPAEQMETEEALKSSENSVHDAADSTGMNRTPFYS